MKFLKFTSGAVLVFACVVVTLTTFLAGYFKGYKEGTSQIQVSSTTIPVPTPTPLETQKPVVAAKPPPSWGGRELWTAVNQSRVQHGVNPLIERDELCTIASIRLNQLLELGKLDGHEGFATLPTTRPDLKWIFDKYVLSEFLVSGATSAQNAVDLWANTLGHVKLLTGGEYVWGCTYAQNGFGVAIAAYQ